MEKIGYVSVLFKQEDLLPDLFKGISIQTVQPYCVYLIDNAPSPGMHHMIESIRKQYPFLRIQHLENSKNLGAAEANNIGIKMVGKDGKLTGAQALTIWENIIQITSDHTWECLLEITNTALAPTTTLEWIEFSLVE